MTICVLFYKGTNIYPHLFLSLFSGHKKLTIMKLSYNRDVKVVNILKAASISLSYMASLILNHREGELQCCTIELPPS